MTHQRTLGIIEDQLKPLMLDGGWAKICCDAISHGGVGRQVRLRSGGTKFHLFVRQLNATDIAMP